MKTTFLAVAVFALVLFTFRDHWISLPSADHFPFMNIREKSSSEGEFFKHALFRNRFENPGLTDALLFRPFFTLITALDDSFFREKFWIQGVGALGWHSLNCFLLLLFLRSFFPLTLSIALALPFVLTYLGSGAFLYHHMVAYLASSILFMLALLGLNQTNRTRQMFAMAAITAGSLVHESIFLANLAMAAWLWIVRAQRSVRLVFIIPIVAYSVLYAIGYILYPPQITDYSVLDTSSLAGRVALLLKTLNWFSVRLLFPWNYSIAIRELGIVQFLNTQSSSPWVGIAFGLALSFLGIYFSKSYVKYRRPSDMIGMFTLLWFLVLVLGIGWGRTNQSAEYLIFATYYHYLFHLMFLILVSLCLHRLRRLAPVIAVGSVALGFHQFLMIQNLVTPEKVKNTPLEGREIAAHTIHALTSYFNENPSHCYGGWFGHALFTQSPASARLILDTVLYRRSCDARGGKPVYLVSDASGNLRWIEFQPSKPIPVSFRQENPTLLSVPSIPTLHQLDLTLDNPAESRLRIGHVAKGNYLDIDFKDLNIVLLQNHTRVPLPRRMRLGFVTPSTQYRLYRRPYELTLKKVKAGWLVMQQNQILDYIPVSFHLSGPVELHHSGVASLSVGTDKTLDFSSIEPIQIPALTQWIQTQAQKPIL